MELVLKSLPKLQVFRYESWYPITPDRAWLQDINLLEVLENLPQTITRFSGYKDSNHIFNRSSRGTLLPDSGSKVFDISQRLKELDLSFIIDAKWFFAPMSQNKDVTWDKLEGLTLTSGLLGSKTSSKDLDGLLKSAARAALRMPKLQMMELWFGKRNQARIFRYTCFRDNALIEWLDTGPAPTDLRRGVKKHWQEVADKYARSHLVFENTNIHPGLIRCRGSILPYLKRRDRTLTSASLQQILWETIHLKRVWRRNPPNANAQSV